MRPSCRSDVITVLVADDQELVREGLVLILSAQSDIEVVGEASDGVQAVALAASTHPDVVLMDMRMPQLDGIEATVRILASGSRCRILILTTYDARRARARGAAAPEPAASSSRTHLGGPCWPRSVPSPKEMSSSTNPSHDDSSPSTCAPDRRHLLDDCSTG